MRLVLYGALVLVCLAAFGALSIEAAGRLHGIRARRRRLGRGELLAAAVGAILAVTLVPTHHGNQVELVPFTRPDLVNALGNVLLFAPLGAVGFLRRWRFAKAVVVGLALSSSVEVAQLVVPGRTTATEDVILNTLGAIGGWAFAALLWRRFVARHAGRAVMPRVGIEPTLP